MGHQLVILHHASAALDESRGLHGQFDLQALNPNPADLHLPPPEPGRFVPLPLLTWSGAQVRSTS